jgi:ABC-type transporter Mla subunit MlaD
MADITAESVQGFLEKISGVVDDPRIQALAPQLDTIRESGKKLAKGLKLTKAEAEETAKAMRQVGKVFNEIIDPIEKFDSALQNAIKTLTGVEDASNTLIGSFTSLMSETAGAEKVANQLAETLDKTFTSLNVGTSIARKFAEATFEMAKEIDAGTAAFNRATGAGGIYNKQIQAAERTNRQFGLSFEENAAARQDLMDGLAGFGAMQAEEQSRLTILSAQYYRLGVSFADFTGILQTGTRALGMTTEQMEGAIEQTRLLAQGLGISVPQAISDLNATLPQLVAFGDEAIDIFAELTKTSQETGIAVGELVSISEGFMTFDDAASAAGNLNAVLGTQLFDTMGLLEAQLQGPDAFINLLRTQLQGSIGDFEELNVFQQQAIANAAGLSVEQVAMLMNSQDASEENTQLQTDFNEALQAGIGLMEQMTIFGKQTAIAVQPVVEGLTSVFRGLNEAIAEAGNLIKITFSVASIGLAVGGMAKLASGLLSLAGAGRAAGLAGTLGRLGLGAAGLAGGGLLLAGGVYGLGKLAGAFADGTDSTPPGPILVGERGPEIIMQGGGNAVLSNEAVRSAARSAMGGGADKAVVAAVQSLANEVKNLSNRPIQVNSTIEMNSREFGRSVNEHFGEAGSSPLRGVG